MPDYIAQTLNSDGARRRRRVAGRDAGEAGARLREKGLFVEWLAPAGPAVRFWARPRITPAHLIQFFQQMEMLLTSGVLIADALDRLKERYPDRRTRRVLREVHAQVAESRLRLSQALALFPRQFSTGHHHRDRGRRGGRRRHARRALRRPRRAHRLPRRPTAGRCATPAPIRFWSS